MREYSEAHFRMHAQRGSAKLRDAIFKAYGFYQIPRRRYNVRRPSEDTCEKIQQAVAEHFKVKVGDLRSASRLGQFVGPRQIAMFVMRERTGASFPFIGQAFGGRDHTTALYSVNLIERRLVDDAALRADVAAIRRRLAA